MGTTATATTSRKVLLPLATLVAAGAVAVGSGATWTSTTDNSVAVTAGNLLHSNSQDGAAMTLSNIKPGDSMTGTVTVANTGTTDSTLDLAVTSASGTFSDFLTITITEDGVVLYNGPLNDLAVNFTQTDVDFAAADAAADVPVVADSIDYVFTVALDAAADNTDQGQTAGAAFAWTQTQVDGESLVENWVS